MPAAVLVEGDDELSGFPVGDAETGGKPVDRPQAGRVHPGFKAPRTDVEAGVNDAAVALADALGQIAPPLQKDEAQPVPGQLPENGATDDAASDDGDVEQPGGRIGIHKEERSYQKDLPVVHA